jgi:hypothetical protein
MKEESFAPVILGAEKSVSAAVTMARSGSPNLAISEVFA